MKLPPLSKRRSPLLAALAGSALLLAGSACTAGGTSPMASRSQNVIGVEEIQGSTASNAYDLIQQVRPNWMRSRGPGSLRDPQPVFPVVYLGDISYGPMESLRGFPTNGIDEIRYINATTATTRFGSGHAGGVIQVFIRR